MKTDFDFIVVGSGLAGLASALVLKDKGSVLLLTKSELNDSATNLAQGGICAVVEDNDSFEDHIRDTLIAGAHHNRKETVEYMVRNAPEAIEWLVKQGVEFDMKDDNRFAPTKEAAHSHNRVLHATDFTGQEIERALVEKVKKEKNITIWQNCFVFDLIVQDGKCFGVQILATNSVSLRKHTARKQSVLMSPNGNFLRYRNRSTSWCSRPSVARKFVGLLTNLSLSHEDKSCFTTRESFLVDIYSKAVVLATGGLGQVYAWTTNPEVATGDGVAMGVRAGCQAVDLEFIQFHPTALKDGKSPLFLLSEALRGEGAYLIKTKNQKPKTKNIEEGERLMGKYDRRAELAPRDVVARAIFAEQKKGNSIFLDIRHRGASFVKKRFVNIYKELKKRGFDLAKEPVPVTPAVHYSCGGIKVDLYGRTGIENLFAFGEVSCTGAHGANRLASNSLLEGVVFPLRLEEIDSFTKKPRKSRLSQGAAASQRPVLLHALPPGKQGVGRIEDKKLRRISGIRKRLKKLMWEKAGIVRNPSKLRQAFKQLGEWERELDSVAGTSMDLAEVKNMVLVSRLIVKSALARKKSLGGHFIEKSLPADEAGTIKN